MINLLPHDLLYEILLRLPVKSILRFKSVSKYWYSLIKNPTYANSQCHISTTRSSSSSHLIIQRDGTSFTLDLDFSNLDETIPTKEIKSNFVNKTSCPSFSCLLTCLGSCNGIICILDRNTKDVCLWNPTINEYRVISSHNFYFTGDDIIPLFFGFGYASTIDDYKIVLVAELYSEDRTLLGTQKYVWVYSLRKNKCNKLKMPPYLEVLDIYTLNNNGCKTRIKEAVLLNNSMYWVVHHKSNHCYYEVNYNNNDHYILKFDMINEVFERIADLNAIDHSSNEIVKRHLKQTDIGSTQDNKLYVCQLYDEASSKYRHQYVVEMRVLDDDQRDSWNIKYRIEQGNLWKYDMLKVTGDGKVIIFENKYRGREIMGKLLIFDGRIGNKGKYIHVDCEYYKESYGNIDISSFSRVVNYVPSLISPSYI